MTKLLWSVAGVPGPEMSAAQPHDTIEDAETSREELTRTSGKRVASIVAEITDWTPVLGWFLADPSVPVAGDAGL